MDFLELSEKINKMKLKKDSAKELLESRNKRLSEIKEETETLLKSQAVLQEVAKEVQSKLSIKIENIVNLGLKTCFGDEYEFKLRYVSARGKTETNFVLLQNGKDIDPMNQNGGGLIDILTLCLRIAVYNISRTDNVIIFDESMKYVSRGLRNQAAELIHTLSEQLGLQFIEVTHIPEFEELSDKKFNIRKIKGVSQLCSE